MAALAALWLEEIRSRKEPADHDARMTVVLMNFAASADVQWTFLQAAVDLAEGDQELGTIAAGPFEHLMVHHGDKYIELVEQCCRENARFARMTTGAWRHLMSDEVWDRIQAIQAAVRDPI